MGPDRWRIERRARQQYDVITRSQAVELGATPDWISRQVTGWRWRRVYRGVYVIHTGPLSWHTRVLAALRYAGDAAVLSHSTAAAWWFERDAVRHQRAGQPLKLSIPAALSRRAQPGSRIHRRPVTPATWPGLIPATTPEETTVDLIARARRTDDVVGILTRTVSTLPAADLRKAVNRRRRLAHRGLVLDVLADVVIGIESPLERHYHRDVERAHGLPRSELQVREPLGGSWIRADCRYRRYRVRVELDGRLAHPGGRTDRDTWRDNAALLASGEVTLRYRWSHVLGAPCRTATQVAVALRRGGWSGTVGQCGSGCAVERGGG